MYGFYLGVFAKPKESELIESKSKNIFDFILRLYQLNRVYYNKIDTWDYQWTFAKLINNYLSIIPKKNLITNVGFNRKGTHTRTSKDSFSKLRRYEISLPIVENNILKHCNNYYNKVVTKRSVNIIKKYLWVK